MSKENLRSVAPHGYRLVEDDEGNFCGKCLESRLVTITTPLGRGETKLHCAVQKRSVSRFGVCDKFRRPITTRQNLKLEIEGDK